MVGALAAAAPAMPGLAVEDPRLLLSHRGPVTVSRGLIIFTMTDDPAAVQRLRLTHPLLPFWIDVGLTEYEGRWLAVAACADEPDIGTGGDPREALRAALLALGESYVSEMTRDAELPA